MGMMRNVPFFKPSIGKEEEQAVLEVLRSGWLTTGPKVQEFESEFARYTNAQNAIAVSSCTAALHLALLTLDLKPDDEVITTPFTFSATASEILHAGGRIRFVDVDPFTGNIDPRNIAQAVNEKTRAIVPVHFAGQPCDMDPIMDIALEHDLMVIEDAAHALETKYKGNKIGSIGDFTCFSFYATKNLTTAEGGMVTCDNDLLAEKVRILSLHGMSKDAWKRYLPDGSAKLDYYKIMYHGYKYNLSDLQAALGLVQLRRIEKMHEARTRAAAIYREQLGAMPEIELLREHRTDRHAHHLMVVKLNLNQLSITRDEFLLKLRERGIGSSIHFVSLHLHPYYQETFGYQESDFPEAAKLSKSVVTLPLFPDITYEDIMYVTDSIKDLVHTYGAKNLISVK
ncbi:MAG: DegT/DnrJ/EryC1/StrS aminotransferase family protein [Candidatus Auribacter fodinae]|jgi:dTDP-4-amino-4,6-dideoxygalactose transaminase|uniref:DegT/DnrJ/EryC1/StrS aminotransferase family protein n=1 Tax=Candidatus Auribacter fodinae TaxID=2093366 RepID=A0A3A4RIV9_9BACT|nr:MAG: DegT/DnrJ/EryC1/StrS aminotransferase family protein [Candidatus Auribacter fodinae]